MGHVGACMLSVRSRESGVGSRRRAHTWLKRSGHRYGAGYSHELSEVFASWRTSRQFTFTGTRRPVLLPMFGRSQLLAPESGTCTRGCTRRQCRTLEIAVSLLFAVTTPHTPSAIRMHSRTAGIAMMRGLSHTEEYRIWV